MIGVFYRVSVHVILIPPPLELLYITFHRFESNLRERRRTEHGVIIADNKTRDSNIFNGSQPGSRLNRIPCHAVELFLSKNRRHHGKGNEYTDYFLQDNQLLIIVSDSSCRNPSIDIRHNTEGYDTCRAESQRRTSPAVALERGERSISLSDVHGLNNEQVVVE